MRVSEAMSTGVIGVDEDTDLFTAVETMLAADVSAVFVFNREGALTGIVSEGDLLHRTELGSAPRRSHWLDLFLGGGGAAREYAHSHGRKVADVMTRFIISIDEDADIAQAIDLMTERHVKRLPVLRGGNVVGVISRSDVLRALHKAQGQTTPAAPGQADSEIGAAIEATIARESWAASNSIRVHVEKGIVTLTGSIGDERIRRALVVIAENASGVVSVRDEIAWIEPNSGILLPSEDEPAA
jgi:CBS domain-containing protein